MGKNKQNSKELVERITKWLDDGKAERIEVIDLAGKADFANYLVVASGRSSKHITSLADDVADQLKGLGLPHVGIEGRAVGDWVLVDAYSVVVHLFRQEVRDHYQIEEMWEV